MKLLLESCTPDCNLVLWRFKRSTHNLWVPTTWATLGTVTPSPSRRNGKVLGKWNFKPLEDMW